MDLEEKVLKAKKGDDNAFYELISERKEMLYRTAYTYVKNKDEALDILDETIYKAYISIKKLKDPRFFNTYLTRILINISLDHIRKNKKINVVELKDNIPIEKANLSFEEKHDLKEAVNKLDEKYKTVIILKYFQDMTIQEISDTLSCPLGTIKSQLHKALKLLKIDLKEGELI
ncbi:sigma-70 family RNA polymerase sigma factor [Clostridium grantii]|uniref:RNA polymerase sigma-70 factor, ECF subfamily n=1 Tax=Clostridium grantii DSM 8605 TaxID=1121316 RepID=A0A1M5VEN2_9CLOT|nr:sigma-70 family RNA polymerase sigma factor [Clostridium grantii]SHH73707.1 RNA polymerase sigma-70 factor, ECF subfamily [Clostridium grantii DSM 8605]